MRHSSVIEKLMAKNIKANQHRAWRSEMKKSKKKAKKKTGDEMAKGVAIMISYQQKAATACVAAKQWRIGNHKA